jgi:hypothetical protein
MMMDTSIRLAAVMSVIALCACAPEDPDDPPIDMIYRASAVLLENTCDGEVPPSGEAWYIDIMPRSDGSCAVNLTGVWLFGQTSFDAIAWRNGAISYQGDWSPHLDGGYFRSAIAGTVTANAAELTLTSEDIAPDGGKCRRSLKLFGLPRRFSDPAAFEGYYKLDALAYVYGCGPNGSGKEAFRGSVIADIDPSRVWEGSSFRLVDGIYFDFGRTDAGAVAWKGPVYSTGLTGVLKEFRGDLTGKVSNDGTDLALLVYGPDTPAGCGVPYSFKGRKILPDASTVDGEYRAEIRRRGQCYGEAIDEKSAAPVTAVEQDDGKVAFYLGTERVVLNRDGNAVSFRKEISESSYYEYSGLVAPPKITLKYSYVEDSWLGPCNLTTEIEAVTRFVPVATD